MIRIVMHPHRGRKDAYLSTFTVWCSHPI